MSDRDRSNQERGYGDAPRRSPQPGDRTPSGASRRHPVEDDAFDIPSWNEPSAGSRSRSSREPYPQDDERRSTAPRRDSRGSGNTGAIPRLGDAFERDRRRQPAEDDRSSAATRDPYDRLRRVANKPARGVSFDDEPLTEFDRDPDDYPDLPPVPRERTRPRRQPSSQPERTAPARPNPGRQLGGAIAAASAQTRFLAGVAGAGLISLVLMAASVAGRVGSLPDWVPIHLNAEGTPDRWGTASTLWRLPLMALVLSIMSGVVAWYLMKRDPFASRFALTSTLVVHLMVWIALVNLLW